jgi:hypothetical protein
MTTFEQAEREYNEPLDDKEYNYCQCCERIECKIFNGKYICEDCEIEQQNETEENL